MRDASFLKTINETSEPLLSRTYSSRSLHSGSFGFGWCARFERRIEILSATQARLYECDRASLVRVVKKKSLWAHPSPEGLEFYNSDGRLVGTDHSQIVFNDVGGVSGVRTSHGSFRLVYQQGSSRIEKIISPRRRAFIFFYDQGDLKAVLHQRRKTRFSYDSFHNLTEIRSPQGREKISYDDSSDEVRSYQNSRSSCSFEFEFQRKSPTELVSTVSRKCPATRVQKKIFSFQSHPASQGGQNLLNVKVSGGFNDTATLP